MKKIFIMIALSLSLFKAQADEGMWLPMLLGKQVYADMVKKGLMPEHSLSEGDLILFASVGAGMNINAICYRV